MAKVAPIYDTLNNALIQYGIFHTFQGWWMNGAVLWSKQFQKCSFVANQFVLNIQFGVSVEKTAIHIN